MKKIFREYGEKKDYLTLQQIDQLPGMEGIIGGQFYLLFMGFY